ncbi:hypothetical protein [Inconstantimicrobium mannanitabidum]|uniref:Uncharacterized protein n=1 Tax=Inconstantimicrobium mannanitabidum TaxID=1604901 RepID=A0ACB5RCT9_9CLOT|nr:hypothetical protein [Clostridium sp. TW13]GKX66890.1 hypothetical protein rsdtw13_21480 [Clostridium sp. TW13]
MDICEFDAIIFGNGMTLNLFEQLRKYVSDEKLYLFNIDEFIKKFISNKLTFKEEQYIEKIFYKKKSIENTKYFNEMKDIFRQYYLQNNSNIEKILGKDCFKSINEVSYDIKVIKDIFPVLYNIWFNEVYRYIIDNNLEGYIETFYNSVKSVLNTNNNIYTTNFDYLSDKYVETKHIHGKFLESIINYEDVVLYMKNIGEYYYKFVWGPNGASKGIMLKEFYDRKIYDKYFDFSFLFGDIKIDNLLIYGLSFQRSGYIEEGFLKAYSKYKNDKFEGTIIDEHLLWRIVALQNLNKLKTVTVSYFSEKEKDYFIRIFEYYKITNINFMHTSKFDFKIE